MSDSSHGKGVHFLGQTLLSVLINISERLSSSSQKYTGGILVTAG